MSSERFKKAEIEDDGPLIKYGNMTLSNIKSEKTKQFQTCNSFVAHSKKSSIASNASNGDNISHIKIKKLLKQRKNNSMISEKQSEKYPSRPNSRFN